MNRVSVIIALLVSLAVWAEDSIEVVSRLNILDSMPRVEVIQDPLVASMWRLSRILW